MLHFFARISAQPQAGSRKKLNEAGVFRSTAETTTGRTDQNPYEGLQTLES